jgi:hypothetical protein
VCTGGNPVVCTADQCHMAGTCDPTTGLCSNPTAKPDGTACGNFCHGATCTDGTCTDSAPPAEYTCRLVFVTSTRHDGNLGGFAGADAICNMRAEDADIGGTFTAWLSDFFTDARDRMPHAMVPYTRVDGAQVAANWDDLTAGHLAQPIDVNETGKSFVTFVWTETNVDGTRVIYPDAKSEYFNYCAGWTSNDKDHVGVAGEGGSSNATSFRWTYTGGIDCDEQGALYCIER